VRAVSETGRLVEEIEAGTQIDRHIHPDERDFFRCCLGFVAEAPEREAAVELRWKGRSGWVNARAVLAHRPAGICLQLTRDPAELARRNEQELRLLIEGSEQGVIVRNNERVLYTNEAFARLMGFGSKAEMIAFFESEKRAGRNDRDNGPVHPDDRAVVLEHMRRRIAGEETVSHYEYRLRRHDGSYLWVEARAALATWRGEPASLSWVIDISHRKRMEEELIRSKEAAEIANRAKTEFLANMSHELRTPLNAIIGFAEVIKDELFGPIGTPKYASYARDIHASGRHLLDLINDILDLSKLEVGKLELREEDVVLARAIDECVGLMRARADQSGVGLMIDVSGNLAKLNCDERALKQVLLNFLSNAVKFTPAGGTVTVRVRRVADGVAVSVKDTGIGMSKADIEVALSPFGQVDSPVARQHKGTGLGLPISKQLIELHGGKLTVDSKPGRGTTMTATFPVSRIVSAAA